MNSRLADRAGTALRRASTLVLDLLLPPQCLSCDEIVPKVGLFCPACFTRAHAIVEPFCRRCGIPRACAAALADGLCAHCLQSPPAFRHARAALLYDDGARALILPLKRREQSWRIHGLAALMARAGAALLAEADLLVPVPLHRRRLLARGYNQAASLARRLAAISGRASLPDALIRTRATRKLGELSAAERGRELTGAIAVRAGRRPRLAGKTILLIDDVLTTGATANACARALCEAGATAVDVLAVARVPDPRAM